MRPALPAGQQGLPPAVARWAATPCQGHARKGVRYCARLHGAPAAMVGPVAGVRAGRQAHHAGCVRACLGGGRAGSQAAAQPRHHGHAAVRACWLHLQVTPLASGPGGGAQRPAPPPRLGGGHRYRVRPWRGLLKLAASRTTNLRITSSFCQGTPANGQLAFLAPQQRMSHGITGMPVGPTKAHLPQPCPL